MPNGQENRKKEASLKSFLEESGLINGFLLPIFIALAVFTELDTKIVTGLCAAASAIILMSIWRFRFPELGKALTGKLGTIAAILGMAILTYGLTWTAVIALSPPNARLVISPTEGYWPLTIDASAEGSTDRDNLPRELSYEWLVDGVNVTSGNLATFTTTFDKTGQKLIEIVVSDGFRTSRAQQTVSIWERNAPKIDLNFSNTEGYWPLTVFADAAESRAFHENSEALTFKWIKNGKEEVVSSQARRSFYFPNEGTYEIKLKVFDGFKESEIVQLITVKDRPPLQPMLQYTLPSNFRINDVVRFSTENNGPLGEPLKHEWFVNGKLESRESTLAYRTAEPGLSKIALRVANEFGQSAHDEAEIKVPEPENYQIRPSDLRGNVNRPYANIILPSGIVDLERNN